MTWTQNQAHPPLTCMASLGICVHMWAAPDMAPGPKGHLSARLALPLTHITLGNPLAPSEPLSFLLSTQQVGKVMG